MSYSQQLQNVMNGIAESVLEMSDEEVREELVEFDLDDEAGQVKEILRQAVQAFKQREAV